jgi:hypothetical protein
MTRPGPFSERRKKRLRKYRRRRGKLAAGPLEAMRADMLVMADRADADASTGHARE